MTATYLQPNHLTSFDGRLPTQFSGYPIATSSVTPGYSSQIPTQRIPVPPNYTQTVHQQPVNQSYYVSSPPPIYGATPIPQGSRIVVGSTSPLMVAPQQQFVTQPSYAVLPGNQTFVQGAAQYSGPLYSNIVGFK